MTKQDLSLIYQYSRQVSEPENLFAGKRLAEDYHLPDNILIFCHDFTAAAPNSHGRCTLVFPLSPMIYYLERERLTMEPGDVLFVPPFTTRFLHPESEGYGRLFITFELPEKSDCFPEKRLHALSGDSMHVLKNVLHAYEKNQIADCAWNLRLFLLTLSPRAIPESPKLPLAVDKAIEFMADNLNRTIGIPDIAEAAGISESHLRALFVKVLGMPPGRYLAEQRISSAKHKLIYTDLSIETIARECGYSNIFAFSCFFKNETGLSPVHFRRRERSRA